MRRVALIVALLAACGDDGSGKQDGDRDSSIDDGDASMPDAGPAACDPVANPSNRCADDTLVTCNASVTVSTDCAAMGQVCTWANDMTGYACLDPATVGAFVVAGTVWYEDKPPALDGSLGPIVPKAARGARISVLRDADSMVLAAGTVADDGTYRLHYNATSGELVHLSAASYNPLPARPIRVTNRQRTVHGFGGASFAAATPAMANLLVTEASTRAQAFNILDQLVGSMDAIRVMLGDPTPVPLVAEWQAGSNDGTYYWQGSIHLLGRSADDDGYDDTVILHEAGHYVEDTQGRTDSPGGSHDGSPTDPRLAWSEGFSTYWAMAVLGAPHYMDSNNTGGWGYDADTTKTLAPEPTGPISQDVSEDMVTEDLWDLGDAGTDDDGFAGSHPAVLRVQVEYLRAGMFRNVGVAGVDLVDFLDGWFAKTGLTACTPARDIITVTRLFPYDYAGPAGTCP